MPRSKHQRTARVAARVVLAVALAGTLSSGAVAESDSPTPGWGGGTYYHPFAGAALGSGLRFNNPFRLEQPLGDSPESVSRSATYGSLQLGVLFGDPNGLQHGVAADLAVALEGIPQEVVSPGYAAAWRVHPRWLLVSRLGVPIVIEPDVNTGLEAAVGAVYFLSAGLGLSLELIGDVFYGAATQETTVTIIPMLSAQLGVRLDYEVLP